MCLRCLSTRPCGSSVDLTVPNQSMVGAAEFIHPTASVYATPLRSLFIGASNKTNHAFRPIVRQMSSTTRSRATSSKFLPSRQRRSHITGSARGATHGVASQKEHIRSLRIKLPVYGDTGSGFFMWRFSCAKCIGVCWTLLCQGGIDKTCTSPREQ